jgi:putative methyltransferase (TIGR04325 family)
MQLSSPKLVFGKSFDTMQHHPLILFVYNRPLFTQQTLAALAENEGADQTDLYVFADGPKAEATQEDLARIQAVHQIIQSATGFKSVHLTVSPTNKGLAQSVLDGVGRMFEQFEAIIAIEDDVVTSPYMLRFMNEALAAYAQTESVMSIGSWNYYYRDPLLSCFFTTLPDTICWATWRRSWLLFEQDTALLYEQLRVRKRLYDFNLQDRFPYEKMLQDQLAGRVNSWAIRWTANACLRDALCLYPNIALSKHIGFGADSTHVKSADYNADLELANAPVPVTPTPIVCNPAAIEAFIHFEKEIRPLKTSKKVKMRNALQRITKPTRTYLRSILSKPAYGWFGQYPNWEAATAATRGYDESSILETVRAAMLQVKQGQARYERDGVILSHPTHTASLISTLYHAATRFSFIHILDFGGSLGSSYFQLKPYLSSLPAVQWSVVEQAHFVAAGQQDFAEPGLDFFPTMEAAVQAHGKPTILLLACTLPYLSDPYTWLPRFAALGADYLLIDNTPFHDRRGDRLTVQKVSPAIYDASYPCWFLDKEKVIAALSAPYQLAFDIPTDTEIPLDYRKIPYESLLFVPRS